MGVDPCKTVALARSALFSFEHLKTGRLVLSYYYDMDSAALAACKCFGGPGQVYTLFMSYIQVNIQPLPTNCRIALG